MRSCVFRIWWPWGSCRVCWGCCWWCLICTFRRSRGTPCCYRFWRRVICGSWVRTWWRWFSRDGWWFVWLWGWDVFWLRRSWRGLWGHWWSSVLSWGFLGWPSRCNWGCWSSCCRWGCRCRRFCRRSRVFGWCILSFVGGGGPIGRKWRANPKCFSRWSRSTSGCFSAIGPCGLSFGPTLRVFLYLYLSIVQRNQGRREEEQEKMDRLLIKKLKRSSEGQTDSFSKWVQMDFSDNLLWDCLNRDYHNLSFLSARFFLSSWFFWRLASCWALSLSASTFLAFSLKMASIKTVLFLNWFPFDAR